MSVPITRLQCIGCGKVHPPDTYRFRCGCSDLLSVEHDWERLGLSGEALRARFEERLGRLAGPDASGVWRYREIILPDLDADAIVTLPEGNTPLYRRDAIARYVGVETLHVKHEGENPTLSFKDRGMTAGVSWARRVGAREVLCASTGDTSAAMACYAAAAGLRAVVLLPHEKVSLEQLVQAIAYGARVLALETDFDGCMALVERLAAEEGFYVLNSMNPFRIEGQKAIGIETVHQLGWKPPDWFVIPVGNAGNIAALGKGLQDLRRLGLIDRLPRIAGVQSLAADPLHRAYREGFARRVRVAAGPTVASAIRIGDPVSFDRARAAVEQLRGVVTAVPDADALDAMAVAGRAGVHICPNSAVALAGARLLAAEGVIPPDQSVVVIATAHGSKFSAPTVAYHRDALPRGAFANPPAVVAPTIEAVRAAARA